MHTLQDCYAHTLRSADARTVYTVLNYIEAVEGNLDEARDGMAHSDALDDCEKPEVAPLVARAAAVSAALATATVALATSADTTLLDAGFGACAAGETETATCEWMHYNPACQPDAQPPDVAACCSTANAYCGSPFLTVAREKLDPTLREGGPLLRGVGARAAAGRRSPGRRSPRWRSCSGGCAAAARAAAAGGPRPRSRWRSGSRRRPPRPRRR